MQRKVFLLIVFLMLFAFVPAVSANPLGTPPDLVWRSAMLGQRVPTRRVGLDIRGTFPYISPAFSAAPFINRHIDDYVVTDMVAEARRLRARAITFDIEYYATDDVVSIILLADVVTTLPHTLVRSVNFCTHSGRLLTINEAAGMEILPLAERILTEKIRGNPERYYAALNSQIPDSFYITDDGIAILFDGFALSTRVSTPDTLKLAFANIHTDVLTVGEYLPNGPYGLKMIPLRDTVERLGFDIRTVREYGVRRIVISRGDIDMVEINRDDNEYVVHGTQRRTLEVAPQLIFNRFANEYRTYVPITFFDQILPNTTYAIAWDDSITFLAYFEDR